MGSCLPLLHPSGLLSEVPVQGTQGPRRVGLLDPAVPWGVVPAPGEQPCLRWLMVCWEQRC